MLRFQGRVVQMTYYRKMLLIAILLMPAIVAAGWINRQGETLPDSDSRKAAGAFGAQLIFVDDENELFKKWATPSETVDVKTIDSVRVNQSINAFVVFSGCTRDDAGNCSVAMRFRVLKPDGSVYAETPPMEVWFNKPAPSERSLELSAQYLKIVIEPTDPLGRYQVHSQVRDYNSGKVLQLSSPFTAVSETKNET
jgi:hypothetical protein